MHSQAGISVAENVREVIFLADFYKIQHFT